MSWLFAAVVMLGTPTDGGVMMYDFQASWCAPCRQMAPAVDQLALDGYPVKKVDIDRDRDLAKRFGVEKIPCFVITVDGREASRVTGLTSFDHLRSLLDQASALKAAQTQKAPPEAIASMPHEMPGGARVNAWGARPPSQPLPSTVAGPIFTDVEPIEPMVPVSFDAPETDGQTLPGMERVLPVTEEELLACTVRIRVQDESGRSSGTGTIIDARRGWALVLTCGHLFRDAKEEGTIEIERFVGGQVQTTKGILRSYNLDRDLGLISFRITDPVRVARVAPPGFDAKMDQSVAGVGCNHGDNPTVMYTRIVAKDSIVGPPNLKTAGLSVEGRSGGGLFSKNGILLGVCNFAMPSDNAAVFAASESIRAELDRAGLSYVYKNPQGTLLSDPAPDSRDATEPLLADITPTMPERMPAAPGELPELTDDAPQPTAVHTQNPATMGTSIARAAISAAEAGVSTGVAPPAGLVQESLTTEESAALAEIRRRRATGSEVICIVRSRSNPAADTEIFVLDKASPAFLHRLAEESSRQEVTR